MENHLLIFISTVSVAVLKRLMILMMNLKTSGLLDDLKYISVLKGCANRGETEEEGNLLLLSIMELIEKENAFLGAGFP
jgi:hypothetical protein